MGGGLGGRLWRGIPRSELEFGTTSFHFRVSGEVSTDRLVVCVTPGFGSQEGLGCRRRKRVGISSHRPKRCIEGLTLGTYHPGDLLVPFAWLELRGPGSCPRSF